MRRLCRLVADVSGAPVLGDVTGDFRIKNARLFAI